MKNTIKNVEKQNEGSYYRITLSDNTALNYFINEDENRKRFVESLKPNDTIEYEPISKNPKFPPFSEEIKLVTAHPPTTFNDYKSDEIARMSALKGALEIISAQIETKQRKIAEMTEVNEIATKFYNFIKKGTPIT